jgi:hypothetical protein
MDAEMVALLESGCALIVGMVTPSGAPFAGRGWGLTVAVGGRSGRLLVDSSTIPALGHAPGQAASNVVGTQIAVTGCDILSYRSLQMKGPITAVEPADERDRARSAQYCGDYFGAIERVDKIPRRLAGRMSPLDITAVVFDIVELYDQSPGPNAGRPVHVVAGAPSE